METFRESILRDFWVALTGLGFMRGGVPGAALRAIDGSACGLCGDGGRSDGLDGYYSYNGCNSGRGSEVVLAEEGFEGVCA